MDFNDLDYKINFDTNVDFENDDQYDIKEGKCKIFGYSLCDKPISYWNNKFIDIASDDKDHEKSVKLMKSDNVI